MDKTKIAEIVGIILVSLLLFWTVIVPIVGAQYIKDILDED
jgi:hypothetical protein